MILKKMFLFLPFIGAVAFAAPNFSIMGFATTEGGTTGGKGGAVVTPATLEQLKQYAEDKTTPYTILITREFNSGVSVKITDSGFISNTGNIPTTYGDIIKLGSNKSLIGVGTSAFFNRIGIIIQCQSNIIIRNIKFTMKYVPITHDGENKIVGWANGAAKTLSDPDCIGIQADDTSKAEADRYSKQIWIDHCEFYNEDPTTGPNANNKDRYDGLVDSKNNSTNITISWCYFHDHHKASLAGKSGNDKFTRKLTYSHNYFKNISSRLPLLRWADCHYVNNYMTSGENGIDDCFSSNLYAEGNYFESMSKPVFGDGTGYATFVGNEWVSCNKVPAVVFSQATGAKEANKAGEEVKSGSSFKPSYSYTVDAADGLKSLLPGNVGVGVINADEYIATSVNESFVNKQISTHSVSVKDHQITVNGIPRTQIALYTLTGSKVFSGRITQTKNTLSFNVNSGTFLVKTNLSNEIIMVH